MQVGENEDDRRELFHGHIKGFTFEEGDIYCITVEVIDVCLQNH
ncbi:MAG: DUF4377 domain-containing protein [Deltaproteobacteria bacterium]|nr:DUF4377 domain-containing protein [Deltaproteobacteria bacterium]